MPDYIYMYKRHFIVFLLYGYAMCYVSLAWSSDVKEPSSLKIVTKKSLGFFLCNILKTNTSSIRTEDREEMF